MCWYELRRSFSRKLFCRSLARLVPEIQPDDLATGGSGVRAQAITPEGDLVQDFRFIVRPERAARAECAEPGGDGVAGHRGGDRRDGAGGAVSIQPRGVATAPSSPSQALRFRRSGRRSR